MVSTSCILCLLYHKAPCSLGPFFSACAGEIDGLNVTIPHNHAVLFQMDAFTETAEAIGAVNTILPQKGRLIGDNTDAAGFLADLRRVLPDAPRPRCALVLGAGGAARAVVYSLLSTGWEVTVAARRLEQSEALVDSLSVSGSFGAPFLADLGQTAC
jgi:shikimate dehydrogenase